MSEQSPPAVEHRQISFVTKLIATGFYAGYAPIAPGTAGSIVAIAIYLLPGLDTPLTLSIVTVCVFCIGVAVSSQMEKALGDDPPPVVIDEMVGQWTAFLFLPKSVVVIVLGFFLFRTYDIFKPPPARRVEKVKKGWGIMLDDVVAGIYANISIWIILAVIGFFTS